MSNYAYRFVPFFFSLSPLRRTAQVPNDIYITALLEADDTTRGEFCALLLIFLFDFYRLDCHELVEADNSAIPSRIKAGTG